MSQHRVVFVFAALAAGTLFSGHVALGQDEKVPPPRKEIVKRVLAVDLSVQDSEPPSLVVSATGQVPTGGWKNAVLLRVVYDKPPADGIQDFIFFADRPMFATQVLSKITGEHTWKGYTKAAPWLKGVRVHGVNGGVMVKRLP